FLRDRAVALTRPDFLIFAQRLDGAVRLDFVGSISVNPRPACPVFSWLYLGMLNARRHSQPSGQHVEVSFNGQHHSRTFPLKLCEGKTTMGAPDPISRNRVFQVLISLGLSPVTETRQTRQIASKALNPKGKSLSGNQNYPTKNPTNACRKPD